MHRQEVEHECPLWMAVQPAGHFSGPVGTDGVQDEMDGLASRRLLIEQGQQLAEFSRAMLEADHAIHLAIVDSEASQQVDGTIAHVFELAACWPTAYR